MKQLNTYMTYDPGILLLCIYPAEIQAYVYLNICIRQFKAELSDIAKKNRRQSKHPSLIEWINCCIFTQ